MSQQSITEKYEYLKLFSFLFFILSVFIFIFSLNKKFKKIKLIFNDVQNENSTIQNASIEEKFYRKILIENNFHIIRLYEENGVFKAIVNKNPEKEKFNSEYGFVIQNVSRDTDLISFIKNSEKITKNNEKFIVNNVVFIDKNNWKILINNIKYTDKSKKIDENTFIQTVTEDYIIIKKNDKIFKILF